MTEQICGLNVGKRLVRSPKVYIRDSGLVHALLGIEDKEALLGHPVVGASWEGMVIENLLSVLGDKALPSFYRTARGAEVDLFRLAENVEAIGLAELLSDVCA